MKWLIIQANGEHTENRFLRECYAWKHGLESNGAVADIWGLGHTTHVENFEEYDVILIAEQYDFAWMPDLYKIKKPIKIQWVVDAHIGFKMYLPVMDACSIILHATKGLIKNYEELFPLKNHLWFPNMVDDRYFKNYNRSKLEDVVFVGGVSPIRRAYLNYLQANKINVHTYFALGERMLDIISSSKIHFNKASDIDLPYRIFETIGLGTCLVTNYDKCLEELGFIDKKNCLFYNTFQDCKEKILDSLENNSWVEIGKAGNLLAQEHTYTKRIGELLTWLK